MTKIIPIITAAAISLTLADAAFAVSPQENAAHMAHDAYLSAINSNDINAFLETVTNDIVFIAPNSLVMEGKAEVGPWVGGYFDAVQTSWEKESVEFVVAGDWAYEWYTYKSVDTPYGGDETYTDTGTGINIYRLGADGIWRVARDAWATDQHWPVTNKREGAR